MSPLLLLKTLLCLPRRYVFHLRGEFEVQKLNSASLSAHALPWPGDAHPGGDKCLGTTPATTHSIAGEVERSELERSERSGVCTTTIRELWTKCREEKFKKRVSINTDTNVGIDTIHTLDQTSARFARWKIKRARVVKSSRYHAME